MASDVAISPRQNWLAACGASKCMPKSATYKHTNRSAHPSDVAVLGFFFFFLYCRSYQHNQYPPINKEFIGRCFN